VVLPQPGNVVRVRSRQFLVDDVRVGDRAAKQQTVISLSCLDDDAQGQSLEVLWETELDAEIAKPHDWKSVVSKGFDEPRQFSAYLNTQRWNLVTSTNPKLFQAPHRAGIEIMSFQVEPLRKALALPRVNLFIADDVGLGKTIEAGLILRELLIRQKVKRVVVAAPPSVVVQWQQELDQRFGLPFVILDRDYVQRRRKERGFAANPWKTHTRFIISHALLRDEQYAAPMRDWLGTFSAGSLLILDEAHNAAPSSSSKYAIDSHLTRVVRDVARRFEHRLFLSATPHNGHSNSFSALLEILDPQRFCRGVPVDAKQRDTVMVRRLKSDLKAVGVPGFPQRDVVQVDLPRDDDDPTEKLLALLDEYRDLRDEKMDSAPKSARAAAKLVIISLQKRLLSSIEAFACTLRAHRRGLAKKAAKAVADESRAEQAVQQQFGQMGQAPGADDDDADLSEDQLRADDDAVMERASAHFVEPVGEVAKREKAVLDEMTSIAEAHRGVPDPRIEALGAWIKKNLLVDGTRWNDRRVLIFTEWMDTKRYLETQLRAAIDGTDLAEQRIDVFHGGMGEDTREEIKRAFNGSPAEHPLRILIATDAAREGVNLQNHCADLFHFDLPWNPSRLEQRNGRIDRKLQRADVVRCHYFVVDGRPEDKVLSTLVQKSQTIQSELGSLSQVLEARMARRLEEGGIRRRDADSLRLALQNEKLEDERKQAVEEELETSRLRKEVLQRELEQLRKLLETSENALGLSNDRFRDALSCSLELLGSKPLQHMNFDDGGEAWTLPALDERLGADPTWAPTLDTLRSPRPRKTKLWDWRKAAKVRPVVFRDTGRLDSDTVHLHLEHRVVQRLLGRFMAQGFVHDDLSRANVVMTDDARRRVVLLGKLALYGDGASRLHEEIVPVTALWLEPDIRKAPLTPYASDAERKTLDLLYTSLADPALLTVPEDVKRKLSALVAHDVQDLLPALAERAKEAEDRALLLLTKRGDDEAKEMGLILEAQEKAIKKKRDEVEKPQMALPFSADELRQLESDKSYWSERLTKLVDEKRSEPERIKRSYAVKVTRVEPIGVIYLWPRSG
jgi:ERCC4-related helicase